ncbi:hypothetical protein WMY93_004179 [Mugilogobius chulae]|uniref:Uncharacterized protein n=1 Tax=Mugilogobius chulae TaxID=88201 RepID=A0AAW0PZ48_9GOBI
MDLRVTSDLRVFWKCLPGAQTMTGERPIWQPLTQPAPPLLHQCPTQRGRRTHPAFVGQESQESRLLPRQGALIPPHPTRGAKGCVSWSRAEEEREGEKEDVLSSPLPLL